jgi:hypothetical protein
MSISSHVRSLAFKADAAIAKGTAVKPGSDNMHVAVSASATSKNMGIAQTVATTAEDAIEIALPGGGAKGLAGGSWSFGDLLTPTTDGSLIVTTTPGDRYIAMAMEDAVIGDLASVEVVAGLI